LEEIAGLEYDADSPLLPVAGGRPLVKVTVMPPIDAETWTQTFQLLLHYYLPPLENSPAVNLISVACMAVGLFLTFHSLKSERSVVCAFGAVAGAWIGYRVSMLVGTPGPISAAVGAVLLAALAYRTHRWWLAAGSVIVLFGLATLFQLGRGDLRRYLPTQDQVGPPIKGDMIGELVSKDRQMSNLYPQWDEQINKMKEKVETELKQLGPIGWLLPVVAAILGALLAFWALRVFAVIWLGFLGASLAIVGACAFVCAHWPNARANIISSPQITAGAAIGLWLLGLILQAKEARLPKKKAGAGAKDSPKS
jgi:hypothetical protein